MVEPVGQLPRSGQGFLNRLTASGVGRLNPTGHSLGRSIESAFSLISQQRAKSSFIDGQVRFLRALSNANRTHRGFAIKLHSPTFSILG